MSHLLSHNGSIKEAGELCIRITQFLCSLVHNALKSEKNIEIWRSLVLFSSKRCTFLAIFLIFIMTPSQKMLKNDPITVHH